MIVGNFQFKLSALSLRSSASSSGSWLGSIIARASPSPSTAPPRPPGSCSADRSSAATPSRNCYSVPVSVEVAFGGEGLNQFAARLANIGQRERDAGDGFRSPPRTPAAQPRSEFRRVRSRPSGSSRPDVARSPKGTARPDQQDLQIVVRETEQQDPRARSPFARLPGPACDYSLSLTAPWCNPAANPGGMSMKRFAFAAVLVAGCGWIASNRQGQDRSAHPDRDNCGGIADSQQRLACYDAAIADSSRRCRGPAIASTEAEHPFALGTVAAAGRWASTISGR